MLKTSFRSAFKAFGISLTAVLANNFIERRT